MEPERIYAWDAREGNVIYRIRGYQHGDGQIDSDEAPVWLLGDEHDLPEGIFIDNLEEVDSEEQHHVE